MAPGGSAADSLHLVMERGAKRPQCLLQDWKGERCCVPAPLERVEGRVYQEETSGQRTLTPACPPVPSLGSRNPTWSCTAGSWSVLPLAFARDPCLPTGQQNPPLPLLHRSPPSSQLHTRGLPAPAPAPPPPALSGRICFLLPSLTVLTGSHLKLGLRARLPQTPGNQGLWNLPAASPLPPSPLWPWDYFKMRPKGPVLPIPQMVTEVQHRPRHWGNKDGHPSAGKGAGMGRPSS